MRLAFAGVDFDIHQAGGTCFEVPENCKAFALPVGAAPTAAQVRVALKLDAALGQDLATAYRVRFRRDGDAVSVDNGHVQANIRRAAPQRYEAEVRVSGDERGRAGALRFVAAALVELEGGLNLHAAAIELNGSALAFTGPSGAGKTTACNLTRKARGLAADQLAVYGHGSSYYAWGLPWGHRADLTPKSSAIVLPLCGLLRVTRGGPVPRVSRAQDTASAMFIVRDAVTVSEDGVEAEHHRLSACQRLCENVRVGTINTVLEHDHAPVLSAFAAGRNEVAAQGVRE